MKDLTRGSIVSHILHMAPPIVVGMITIMICQLVDLYFVSGLGDAADCRRRRGRQCRLSRQCADAGARRRHGGADRACRGTQGSAGRQSDLQPGGRAVGAVRPLDTGRGRALSRLYMRSVAADQATIEAGTIYLLWFMPALALQFATQVMASALRATGIVRPAHAGAGPGGRHQHRAGAGADLGLGHRLCARRCRRGAGELDRGRHRRSDAACLFPQGRALCRL